MGATALQKTSRGHIQIDAQVERVPGLRQIVRERLALSDEADIHALAADLMRELPRDMLEQLALKGLTEVIGEEERARRRPTRRGGPTVPRHSQEAFRAAAVEFDLYSLRYPTPDGWKVLGDFTRDDALWTVARYEESAAADLKEAGKFRAIAKRATKGRTVREAIPHGDLETIIHA